MGTDLYCSPKCLRLGNLKNNFKIIIAPLAMLHVHEQQGHFMVKDATEHTCHIQLPVLYFGSHLFPA